MISRRRSAGAPPLPRADGYLTDGRNLYRFVCWLNRPVKPRLAELENCRSLESVLVSSEDLARLGLRPVSAGGGPVESAAPALWGSADGAGYGEA